MDDGLLRGGAHRHGAHGDERLGALDQQDAEGVDGARHLEDTQQAEGAHRREDGRVDLGGLDEGDLGKRGHHHEGVEAVAI